MKERDQIEFVRVAPVFSKGDAIKIIEKTVKTPTGIQKKFPQMPNPESLAHDLNVSYHKYLGWKEGWDQIPTKKILLDQISDAKKKTDKTIKIYDSLIPNLEKLEQVICADVLSSVIDGINNELTELAIVFENLGMVHDHVFRHSGMALTRKGKTAETYFMCSLLPEVYSKNFGKKPSRSTLPDGKPAGPMFRFTQACMDHLQIAVTAEAIASSRTRPAK